jgi:hypothetical protein
VSEEPEKPKWGKDKVFVFAVAMIFLFIGVPTLIILYVVHKLSQIH